ncbi:MAG TPA: potassium transporter TrkG [Acidimicrobiia bacterium]|nr:potassium transporter TrkG [Acidimicrobiia bacterium]
MLVFAGATLVGTGMLMLPVASEGPGGAGFVTALFTATSAVCVTGHVVVDTASYWSGFGEGVILGLIQLGGFGIMTAASLMAILIARRLGLRQRMIAQAETKALDLGDVRQVLKLVAVTAIVVETVVAVALIVRFTTTYDEPLLRSVWLGVFHAVSAFNNAGFSLFPDNLMRFVADWWINGFVMAAIVIGGLGLPVVREILREWNIPRRWSVHTKLTIVTAGALIAVGFAAITWLEWGNPDTLGPLAWPHKLLAGLFQAVTPRTAGFNTVDYADMDESSWLVTTVLMFIGGGSASTAGGIKVTTFALLGFVIWSELRGEPDVNLFGRRSALGAQRQALTIALLAVAAVVAGTLLLLVLDPFPLGRSLFEVTSAFGTVGLSTGITAALSSASQLVLVVLMFLGRLGPATLGTALVLRAHDRRYRFPEERPIVG